MSKHRIAAIIRDANRSEVARRTGISLSGVSRILSGHRAASSRKLNTIALALGMTMDELHGHLTGLQAGLAQSGRGSRGNQGNQDSLNNQHRRKAAPTAPVPASAA